MIRSRRQTQRLYDLLAYVILIATFTFAVFPILWTLLTSLKSNADIVTADIQYIPLRPNLQNYATLWGQAGFPTMFFNSAVVTVLTVVVCLAVGISGAYSLSRYRFRARGQILLYYLVVRMFPAVLLLLARPGVAATAVLIAISSWNEFLFALMLTTSQGIRTWPVGLQLMVGEYQLPWGLLTAGGIISIAPILVFFALVQRALRNPLHHLACRLRAAPPRRRSQRWPRRPLRPA